MLARPINDSRDPEMFKNSEQFVAEVSFETEKLSTGVKQANKIFETFEDKSNAVFEKFSSVAVSNINRVQKELDRES